MYSTTLADTMATTLIRLPSFTNNDFFTDWWLARLAHPSSHPPTPLLGTEYDYLIRGRQLWCLHFHWPFVPFLPSVDLCSHPSSYVQCPPSLFFLSEHESSWILKSIIFSHPIELFNMSPLGQLMCLVGISGVLTWFCHMAVVTAGIVWKINCIKHIFFIIGLILVVTSCCVPLQKIRGKMKPATSLVVVGGGDDLVGAKLRWSCSAVF